MFSRDLISAVREMMERNWDLAAMSSKLKLNPQTVQAVIDFINNIAT